ncbi:MAG TPA: hypothetical protein VK211_06810 [Kamptonema sp.]|nr:hypothetical protein [Kamptonema sp.]
MILVFSDRATNHKKRSLSFLVKSCKNYQLPFFIFKAIAKLK